MQRCPVCALPETSGGVFRSTGRQLVADVCNHVMDVHHGGPADAWWAASMVDPFTCKVWEQEVLNGQASG